MAVKTWFITGHVAGLRPRVGDRGAGPRWHGRRRRSAARSPCTARSAQADPCTPSSRSPT